MYFIDVSCYQTHNCIFYIYPTAPSDSYDRDSQLFSEYFDGDYVTMRYNQKLRCMRAHDFPSLLVAKDNQSGRSPKVVALFLLLTLVAIL